MQALPVDVCQDPGLGHVIRIVRSDGDKDQVTVACVGGRAAKAASETKDLRHMLGFEHGPIASVPRPGVVEGGRLRLVFAAKELVNCRRWAPEAAEQTPPTGRTGQTPRSELPRWRRRLRGGQAPP